jgi:hypothetical protein
MAMYIIRDKNGIIYQGKKKKMRIAYEVMIAGLGEVAELEDLTGKSWAKLIKTWGADFEYPLQL